jgi:hypothetical protein
MLKPIADGIGIQTGAVPFDRFAHWGRMGREEKCSEVNKLWGKGKLCPQVIPAYECVL